MYPENRGNQNQEHRKSFISKPKTQKLKTLRKKYRKQNKENVLRTKNSRKWKIVSRKPKLETWVWSFTSILKKLGDPECGED